MECPQCKDEFDIEDADINTRITEVNDQNMIDISVDCPACNQQAFYSFIELDDLTPNKA